MFGSSFWVILSFVCHYFFLEGLASERRQSLRGSRGIKSPPRAGRYCTQYVVEPRFDKSTTSIDKLSTTYRQVDKSTSRQVDNVSTSRQVSTSELTPSRVLPCASLSIVKSTSRQVDKIDNVLTSKFNDTYPNCYPTTSSMHPKLLYLSNCLSGPVAM